MGGSSTAPRRQCWRRLAELPPKKQLPIQTHRHLQLTWRVEDIVVGSQMAKRLALNARRSSPKPGAIEYIECFETNIQVHTFRKPDFAIHRNVLVVDWELPARAVKSGGIAKGSGWLSPKKRSWLEEIGG